MVSDTFVDAEAFSTRGNGPQASETPPQDKLPETRTIKGPRLVRGVACCGDERVQLGNVGSTLEGARRRSASVLGKPGCPGPSWCRVGQESAGSERGRGAHARASSLGRVSIATAGPRPPQETWPGTWGALCALVQPAPPAGLFRPHDVAQRAARRARPGALAPGDTRKGTSPRD